MTRKEFLHCQMCKHCYDRRCRDLSGQWISLCEKHHWPTYDPSCPDWEENPEDNWAKCEYERRRQQEAQEVREELKKIEERENDQTT
jgi:hypothetical protein